MRLAWPRGVTLAFLLGLGALSGCGGDDAGAAPVGRGTSEPACTDPDTPTVDPACFVQGNAAHLVRTACDAVWIAGVCDTVAFGESGYAVSEDPNPEAPYFLAIGALHEHSGYSDGDPLMIPRDYLRAGRSGHNTADGGDGDSGLQLDFMFSSEHSDNEKLPVTTSADCIPIGTDLSADPSGLSGDLVSRLLACAHLGDLDHYFKWQATLRQMVEGSDTESDAGGGLRYTGFTGARGFEWTNDFYNHMNVYFSTHVVNAKVDGSYAGMNFMWSWLREPVANGGGADALAVFNHPGQNPALTPFDGGLPHNELLALTGGANWNDLAYEPSVDARVVGIEVNGGDDLGWYIKALQRGWHLGPVGAEDEHQREWATITKPKTVLLTRGRSPQDYYYALANRRSMSLRPELLAGTPGTRAQFPQIHFYANGEDLQSGVPLGSILRGGGTHTLHVGIAGLPVGSRVAMIGGPRSSDAPLALGAADNSGRLDAQRRVDAPAHGEDWYFVVVCPADEEACGQSENYLAVTAPIWIAAAAP